MVLPRQILYNTIKLCYIQIFSTFIIHVHSKKKLAIFIHSYLKHVLIFPGKKLSLLI